MSGSEVIGVGAMVLFAAIGLAAPYCRWGEPIVQIWEWILGAWLRALFGPPLPRRMSPAARAACAPDRRTPLRCPLGHCRAVAVEDPYGETVAHLCPDCDEQLAADWRPSFTDVFFDPKLVSGRRRSGADSA